MLFFAWYLIAKPGKRNEHKLLNELPGKKENTNTSDLVHFVGLKRIHFNGRSMKSYSCRVRKAVQEYHLHSYPRLTHNHHVSNGNCYTKWWWW
jgi:hypothetical protein